MAGAGRGSAAGVRRPLRGGAANPVFRLDTPGGIAKSAFADVANPLRAPISSGCTANPTNADGSACQAGAAGTPFFLYTAGASGSQKLFADAFVPTDVTTLAATDVTSSGATLHGSANPGVPQRESTSVRRDDGVRQQHGRRPPGHGHRSGVVRRSAQWPRRGLHPALPRRRPVRLRHHRRADQALDIVNLPPAFSLGALPGKVHLRKLGRDRVLDVPVQLSEPATVTIELLRRQKVVRQMTAQAPAGASVIPLSLKHVRRGRYTLQVVATTRAVHRAIPWKSSCASFPSPSRLRATSPSGHGRRGLVRFGRRPDRFLTWKSRYARAPSRCRRNRQVGRAGIEPATR